MSRGEVTLVADRNAIQSGPNVFTDFHKGLQKQGEARRAGVPAGCSAPTGDLCGCGAVYAHLRGKAPASFAAASQRRFADPVVRVQ